MNLEQWHDSSAGKELVGFNIILSKEYLNHDTGEVTCHNVSYYVPAMGHDVYAEVLFSDVQHAVEDEHNRLKRCIDLRHRKTIRDLENIRRFL